jgi:hypothetical protein
MSNQKPSAKAGQLQSAITVCAPLSLVEGSAVYLPEAAGAQSLTSVRSGTTGLCAGAKSR